MQTWNLVLALAFSYTLASQPSFAASFPPGIPGVVFTAEETEQMTLRSSVPALTGPFWTPSTEQVLAMEKRLPSYLYSMEGRSQINLKRNLILYKRQYFGITASDARVILVNFFSEQYWKYNDDWMRRFVEATFFRGDNFFRIKYDPQSGQFIDLLAR